LQVSYAFQAVPVVNERAGPKDVPTKAQGVAPAPISLAHTSGQARGREA
jgi:hypothetical protein